MEKRIKENCCICGEEYIFLESDYSNYHQGYVCMNCRNLVDCSDYIGDYDEEWENR